MNRTDRLVIDGAVENPLELSFDDLSAFPEHLQYPDVSKFHPNRIGKGVDLEAILVLASPRADANYLTLHAARDDFHVSIPLEAIRGHGIVVYRFEDGPLPLEQGGPIRFLVKDPSACHNSELDECANVKYLSRLELSARKRKDTRPIDETAHALLHESQGT